MDRIGLKRIPDGAGRIKLCLVKVCFFKRNKKTFGSKNNTSEGLLLFLFFFVDWIALVVHSAGWHGSCSFFLRNICNDRLRCEEESRNRNGVFKSSPDHLRRVKNPSLDHIDKLTAQGIVTHVIAQFFDMLKDNGTLLASIESNLTERA